MNLKILFTSLLGACLLAAQPPALSGPVAGFIHDPPARSLRIVAGIPGAARLGAAVVEGVDAAWLAPNGEAAVLWSEGTLRVVPHPGATQDGFDSPRPEITAWSPDSTTVALYAASKLLACQVKGSCVEVPLPAPIQALAAFGETVAVATLGEIYLLRPHAAPVLVAAMPISGPLAFSPDGHTLFAADRENGCLLAIRGVDTAPEIIPFGQSASGAIAVRKQRLYVTDPTANTIKIFDTPSLSQIAELPLETTPRQLEPLSVSGSMVVSARQAVGDAAWILVTDPQPAIYFVPGEN